MEVHYHFTAEFFFVFLYPAAFLSREVGGGERSFTPGTLLAVSAAAEVAVIVALAAAVSAAAWAAAAGARGGLHNVCIAPGSPFKAGYRFLRADARGRAALGCVWRY